MKYSIINTERIFIYLDSISQTFQFIFYLPRNIMAQLRHDKNKKKDNNFDRYVSERTDT